MKTATIGFLFLWPCHPRPCVLVYHYIMTLEGDQRMLFTIQTDGSAPIYEQIVAQVIYGVAAGALETGSLIPSVRELAENLLVDPNTVARAFQELERAGVVTARRGVGMEVMDGAPAACRAKRRD